MGTMRGTVYPKKYAHGFCFAVLCCGYTLTDFTISIRLTSLALWQSNDCPSASKATLMNMDKYFMWIHYERLHNHNKAKHSKTVCIFLGIYCMQHLTQVMSFDWVRTFYFREILKQHIISDISGNCNNNDNDKTCKADEMLLKQYFTTGYKQGCIMKRQKKNTTLQCN